MCNFVCFFVFLHWYLHSTLILPDQISARISLFHRKCAASMCLWEDRQFPSTRWTVSQPQAKIYSNNFHFTLQNFLPSILNLMLPHLPDRSIAPNMDELAHLQRKFDCVDWTSTFCPINQVHLDQHEKIMLTTVL